MYLEDLMIWEILVVGGNIVLRFFFFKTLDILSVTSGIKGRKNFHFFLVVLVRFLRFYFRIKTLRQFGIFFCFYGKINFGMEGTLMGEETGYFV